jgi:hypothetical protein
VTSRDFKTLCEEEPARWRSCDTSQSLLLPDFTLDPDSGLVSWIHSLPCIASYGLQLCLAGQCPGQGVLQPGEVGDRLEQDLHLVPGVGRLRACAGYTLTVLPSARVGAACLVHGPLQLLGLEPRSAPLARGFSHPFHYTPGGRGPPQVRQVVECIVPRTPRPWAGPPWSD